MAPKQNFLKFPFVLPNFIFIESFHPLNFFFLGSSLLQVLKAMGLIIPVEFLLYPCSLKLFVEIHLVMIREKILLFMRIIVTWSPSTPCFQISFHNF